MGNSPTYAEGNEQYQQPVYLSDNQVQFVLNTSAVGPGPYYLWITNNSQATNDYYMCRPAMGAQGEVQVRVQMRVQGAEEGRMLHRNSGIRFISGRACKDAAEFRDTFLLTNTPGKAFVEWYYRHSPKYAGMIAGRPALRAIARTALLPYTQRPF